MGAEWANKMRTPGTTLENADKNAFWRELLADELIAAREKEFAALKAQANAKAINPTDDTSARDADISALHQKQIQHAAFSNAVRKAVVENFELILSLDRSNKPRLYADDKAVDKLRKEFEESYNDALREYEIMLSVRRQTHDELLEKFNKSREILIVIRTRIHRKKDDLNTAAHNAQNSPTDDNKKTLQKCKFLYQQEINGSIDLLKPARFDSAIQATLRHELTYGDTTVHYKQELINRKKRNIEEINAKLLQEKTDDESEWAQTGSGIWKLYLGMRNHLKKWYGYYDETDVSTEAKVLAILAKEEDEKLALTNRKWWAIWIGLKNSKYFSLSCGTTMGGALIIIMAPFGTAAMIIATIVSVPVVYIVTRADWWMTNRAVPELALDILVDPIGFIKNFFRNAYKNPISTLYKFVVTFVVSVVWAGLTYDTTLELTKQLYEKSTISGGLASSIVLGITAIMAGAAIYKLGISRLKNGKFLGLKSIWTFALVAATAGLGYWVLGAESAAFQQASVLAITIMMTVYTVPTLYTIFNLYTDRFVKAFKGPVDQETGEDNEFHYKNIDKSYDNVVNDVINKGQQAKFRTTYNVIMGIGLFIAFGLTVMLQQTIVGDSLSFTGFQDYSKDQWLITLSSLLGSAGVVTLAVSAIFQAINYYAPPSNAAKTSNEINKAMLYKALVVLGGAALIGTFAIVMASEHIMGNIFTKWLGASEGQVPVLNAVFTMGIGFLGAAGFYFGNAIRTVKNLFKATEDNLDLGDPTGQVRQPDFSKCTYENKTLMGKAKHRVCDSANWFGQDPAKKEAEMTVLGNSLANSFQTVMSASSTAAAVVFSTSATLASGAASIGTNNFTQYPMPDAKRQESKVAMLKRV